MPNLIGTGLDQVPMNGMLGDLAFQNKESVEFTDGKGGLSHLTITAINATKNITAVSVFVYDTSKDSDGGAWRKRTQHTSWYNEELNTATRGSRREFPAVAVIVATATSVIIYDGDDASLPMWMVFNEGATRYVNTNGIAIYLAKALNGKMVVTGFRIGFTDFIGDRGYSYEQSYYNWSNLPISYRNTFGAVSLYRTQSILSNNSTTGLAMTVTPNATIDVTSGLPIPTVVFGVGTTSSAGGIFIITDTGAIKSGGKNNDSWRAENVAIDKYLNIWAGEELDWAYGGLQLVSEYPWNVINAIGVGSRGYPQMGAPYSQGVDLSNPNIGGGGYLDPTATKDGVAVGHTYSNFPFHTGGFTLLRENTNRAKTMVAIVNQRGNSGWVVGRGGSWMGDPEAGTLQPVNLVVNPTFDSNVNSWSPSGATTSLSSGKMLVTSTSTALYGVTQAIGGLVVGKTYTFACDVSTSYAGGNVRIQISGVGAKGDYQISLGAASNTVYGSFVAGSTTATLEIFDYSTHPAGTAFTVDNVRFKMGDANRSDAYFAAEVNGTLTKVPVAPGADICAYTGFSGNSLVVPKGAINLNNSSFTMMCWFRSNDASTEQLPISTGDYGTSNKIRAIYVNSGNLGFAGWSNDWLSGRMINDGRWHLIAITAELVGSVYNVTAYDNGERVASNNMNNLSTFVNTAIDLGGATIGGGRHIKDAMCMARVSKVAATDEQMRKIYEDERHLFTDNAKALVYGAIGNTTALSYDEETELLHIGTAAGRSVFDGLRRIDNTTTAVARTISAANGLVAED